MPLHIPSPTRRQIPAAVVRDAGGRSDFRHAHDANGTLRGTDALIIQRVIADKHVPDVLRDGKAVSAARLLPR